MIAPVRFTGVVTPGATSYRLDRPLMSLEVNPSGPLARARSAIVAGGSSPAPAALVARTVQLIGALPLSPMTVAVSVTGPTVASWELAPCVQVTVYPVIGDPPSDAGAAHVTTVPAGVVCAAIASGTLGGLATTGGALCQFGC